MSKPSEMSMVSCVVYVNKQYFCHNLTKYTEIKQKLKRVCFYDLRTVSSRGNTGGLITSAQGYEKEFCNKNQGENRVHSYYVKEANTIRNY